MLSDSGVGKRGVGLVYGGAGLLLARLSSLDCSMMIVRVVKCVLERAPASGYIPYQPRLAGGKIV